MTIIANGDSPPGASPETAPNAPTECSGRGKNALASDGRACLRELISPRERSVELGASDIGRSHVQLHAFGKELHLLSADGIRQGQAAHRKPLSPHDDERPPSRTLEHFDGYALVEMLELLVSDVAWLAELFGQRGDEQPGTDLASVSALDHEHRAGASDQARLTSARGELELLHPGARRRGPSKLERDVVRTRQQIAVA